MLFSKKVFKTGLSMPDLEETKIKNMTFFMG